MEDRQISLIRYVLGITATGLIASRYFFEYYFYGNRSSFFSNIFRSISFLMLAIFVILLVLAILYFSYVILKKSYKGEEISREHGKIRKPFAFALVFLVFLPMSFGLLFASLPLILGFDNFIKIQKYFQERSSDKTIVDIKVEKDLTDLLNWQTYKNYKYGISFAFPGNYFIASNEYGSVDHSESRSFFFRKKSDDYNGVPALEVSSGPELSSGQTLGDLVKTIYEINQKSGYTTTDLEVIDFAGLRAYRFGLNSSYADGSQMMDSSGAMVLFLQKDDKVLRFLQTGDDDGLEAILNSLKFI